MNISIWDIFKYLLKWKFVIAVTVVISAILAYVYVDGQQSYNSTVIIQLNDKSILNGNAPDGTVYDYYEIVSPNVLTDVIEELSLKKTVDSLRERVTVTPIIPESEKEIQKSKEKDGEKHEFYPNTFSVTYKGKSSESTGDVRDILDSIIDNYIDFYNEKYSSKVSINEIAYSNEMGDYDYIEMADMLSENISTTMTTLESCASSHDKFRSSTTGHTFSDLINEYKYIDEFSLPDIYSIIYAGQVTKNKPLLINNYTYKAESYLVEKANYEDAANIAKSRMDSFSKANRNVPNAYNKETGNNDDDLEIIDGVYEWINPNNTETTYDQLITSYVDSSIAANNMQLKADHCVEVVQKFSREAIAPADEATINAVAESITAVKNEMTELGKTTQQVIDDYNKYTFASHISLLTGVNYYATMSFYLYALIAVVIGALLSILAVLTIEISGEMKKHYKEEE